MTETSPSATANSGSQLSKQTHKVSAARTSYYPQPRPHPIELLQILPTLDSFASLTLANRGPRTYCDHTICQILQLRSTIIHYQKSIWSCWRLMYVKLLIFDINFNRSYSDSLIAISYLSYTIYIMTSSHLHNFIFACKKTWSPFSHIYYHHYN